MSICLTKFPISGLGEPNIYHDSVGFYKNVGFYLEVFGGRSKLIVKSHFSSRVVQYTFARDIVTI